MNSTAIINRSDRRSRYRALHEGLTARLYKVEDNKVIYTVTSSHKDRQYIVTFLLLDITGNKLKSLQAALNGNLKIKCSCDAFLFQGYKYISYHANAGIDPESRAPDIRNPNKEGMACKHIIAALMQMKKDYAAIYNLFKLQSPKGSTQKQSDTSVKDNSKSDSPTEYDIKIITDFYEACKSLYNQYKEFNSNEEDGDFLDSDYFTGTDPSSMLKNLSKPAIRLISSRFIGKLKSLGDILKTIDLKKNGFNILLDSDVKSVIKRLNSSIHTTVESLINNIILNLVCS